VCIQITCMIYTSSYMSWVVIHREFCRASFAAYFHYRDKLSKICVNIEKLMIQIESGLLAHETHALSRVNNFSRFLSCICRIPIGRIPIAGSEEINTFERSEYPCYSKNWSPFVILLFLIWLLENMIWTIFLKNDALS
jgi:hypothetical protein